MLKHRASVHDDVRTFRCPYCDAVFSQRTVCDAHVRNVHDKKQAKYFCEQCGLPYSRKKHLHDHYAEVHPHLLQAYRAYEAAAADAEAVEAAAAAAAAASAAGVSSTGGSASATGTGAGSSVVGERAAYTGAREEQAEEEDEIQPVHSTGRTTQGRRYIEEAGSSAYGLPVRSEWEFESDVVAASRQGRVGTLVAQTERRIQAEHGGAQTERNIGAGPSTGMGAGPYGEQHRGQRRHFETSVEEQEEMEEAKEKEQQEQAKLMQGQQSRGHETSEHGEGAED